MKTYVCSSLAEFYSIIYEDMKNAPEISPRGLATKEIIAPQIMLLNPKNRLALNDKRKFSTKYAITESLMLFDSAKAVKYFSAYNGNIVKFSDDGIEMFGSYGFRIADNIPKMIELLKTDEITRQAVLPILGKNDVYVKTKDTPCTISLQIIIRNNKVNMIVNMRSNDIIWGLPYDIFMFTTLQEIVANSLGLEMGWYLHRPISLHLYSTHYELFDEVANKFENKEVHWVQDYDTWKKYATTHKQYVDGKIEISIVDLLYEIIKGDRNA